MAKSKSYSGWNTYDSKSQQPVQSGGYSGKWNPGGSQSVMTGRGYNPFGLKTGSAPSGRLSAQSTRTSPQRSSFGGGGGYGGSTYDDSQDLNNYLAIAGFQQRQNTATRDMALGQFGGASALSGRAQVDPYNEGMIGLMKGEQKDVLSGQKNAQLRKLQDISARRGGAVGYGMENELQARYQKNLGDAMRSTRIQAIDKNRRALEAALAAESNLASQKASVVSRHPVAVDLPQFNQPSQQMQGATTQRFANGTSSRNSGGGSGIGIRRGW